MNTAGTFESWGDAFPVDVIPEILLTVVTEWPNCSKPTGRQIENPFTNRLVGHLNRVTRRKILPFAFTYRDKIANPDGDSEKCEIDITVRAGSNHHVFFCFECKRLNVLDKAGQAIRSNAEKYVGKDGMCCFVSGKYDGGVPHAGMIGYVMNGDVDNARMEVDRHVKKAARRLALRAPKELHFATIVPGSGVYQTVHTIRRNRFIIYHLFLPVPVVAIA